VSMNAAYHEDFHALMPGVNGEFLSLSLQPARFPLRSSIVGEGVVIRKRPHIQSHGLQLLKKHARLR